nr:MAG TPA: hypothetical protein [Caudoviricetes sp.]
MILRACRLMSSCRLIEVMQMDNGQVKEIFWQVYNVYWNKWKNVPLTRHSPEWDEIVAEGAELIGKYHCDLCNHMVSDMIQILKERYEEEERKKL